MAFESGLVPKDWRSALIVPLYKDIRKRTSCKNYYWKNIFRNISGQSP